MSAEADPNVAGEQEINPWSVSAGVDAQGKELAFDYDAISRKWNTNLIDDALLKRFTAVTGKEPHIWLRRGLFFSHRDFNLILDRYERGEPFFLYTGRGPSSGSMHVGHTIPFEFTKWLQDVFDVPLVIMLTDDEKALFKDELDHESAQKYGLENAKDIISIGFDMKKTFIYLDSIYTEAAFRMNTMEFAGLVTFNQVRGTFGFDDSTNIGRIFFPSVQCVAAFATSYPHIWSDPPSKTRTKAIAKIPCLIPMGIDQDPYFRLVRNNSHRMKNPSPKPALIHSKFITSLQGPGGKMSASDPNSAIFMSDTPKQVKTKINKSFSGGQETLEEHQRLGGNPDVDVAFQYLTYFEEDDNKVKDLYEGYKAGKISTGEMKRECYTHLQGYVAAYQERRKAVTDAVLGEYMRPRKLEWKGNPSPKKKEAPAAKEGAKKGAEPSKVSAAEKKEDSVAGGVMKTVTDALAAVGLPQDKPDS